MIVILAFGRMSGAAMEMYKLCYNCVWVVVLAAFCLAAVGCLSGQMFKLPFVRWPAHRSDDLKKTRRETS